MTDAPESEADDPDRSTFLVDASAFITLAAIEAVDLLAALDGDVVVPERVADELVDERSRAALSTARDDGTLTVSRVERRIDDARTHLGGSASGDVGLLAHALAADSSVVAITDDKPLRRTCKTLSIPVSGSIGVLIRAVELCVLDADEATDKLYAMDEVGARLSASLVRRAERLIEDAVD